MNKIKYLLATGGASAVLVLGLAAPVAADAGQIGGLGDNNSQSQTNTEDSPSNNDGNQANNGGLVQEVSGDCSAAFVSDIDQNQDNDTLQVNANVPIDVDANVDVTDDASIGGGNSQSTGSSSNSSSQSNSVSNSQSNSGPSFEADCSQENVTNVTKVVQASAKAQVSAPKGGVSAGAGEATSLQSLLGLFGSLGTTGFGLGLRFLKRG